MGEFSFSMVDVVGKGWYIVIAIIIFDVITGLLAAAVEKKINSSINYVGLIRKVGLFVALGFFSFMDVYTESNGLLIKLGVTMIVCYEGMSIVENFSRIGIDISFLTKYFDKSKLGGKNDGNNDE